MSGVHVTPMRRILRSRQSLGKYRVEKLLAQGGFAEVYRAFATIEGLRVALKIPYAHLIDQDLLDGISMPFLSQVVRPADRSAGRNFPRSR